MQSDVKQMMDSVSKDIYITGPVKWLYYFEDTTSFCMASEGKLIFPNYSSAKTFINDTLVHAITKVKLIWSDTQIDSLNTKTVAINSAYHEDMTLANGNILHQGGYCTAIIDHTNSGWKFRNLHWSTIK